MLGIFFCLIFAVIAGVVASGKNRNPFGWGVLGFLIPIVGLVAVVCLPPLELAEATSGD